VTLHYHLLSLILRLKEQKRSRNTQKTWLPRVRLIWKVYHRSKWLSRVPILISSSCFSRKCTHILLLNFPNLSSSFEFEYFSFLAMMTSQKRPPLLFLLRQLWLLWRIALRRKPWWTNHYRTSRKRLLVRKL
jgi:hypothetical protein